MLGDTNCMLLWVSLTVQSSLGQGNLKYLPSGGGGGQERKRLAANVTVVLMKILEAHPSLCQMRNGFLSCYSALRYSD